MPDTIGIGVYICRPYTMRNDIRAILGLKILKCIIPAGNKIQLGIHDDFMCLLTDTILPIAKL